MIKNSLLRATPRQNVRSSLEEEDPARALTHSHGRGLGGASVERSLRHTKNDRQRHRGKSPRANSWRFERSLGRISFDAAGSIFDELAAPPRMFWAPRNKIIVGISAHS